MISIIYCTKEHNQKHIDHLKKTAGHPKVEVIEYINKGEGLTKFYNKGLEESKFDVVVFLHDDITLETKQWANKLNKLFDKNPEYGIIGVAGTKNMPESGRWWENKNKMYGRVAHTNKGKTWLSSYSDDLGTNIEEVVIVDGVFFAVKKSRIKTNFDESVTGFHFYEISFCFQNYLKGVKIGVTTRIRVNHMSIGITNDEWEENRKVFSEKHKDDLPVNIKREFRDDKKFKILLGSETIQESMELAIKLVNLNHSVTIVAAFDKDQYYSLRSKGIKFFPLNEPLGYKLGDGEWSFRSEKGEIVTEKDKLYKISNVDFEIFQASNQQVKDYLIKLYSEVPCAENIVNGLPIDDIIFEYKNILA